MYGSWCKTRRWRGIYRQALALMLAVNFLFSLLPPVAAAEEGQAPQELPRLRLVAVTNLPEVAQMAEAYPRVRDAIRPAGYEYEARLFGQKYIDRGTSDYERLKDELKEADVVFLKALRADQVELLKPVLEEVYARRPGVVFLVPNDDNADYGAFPINKSYNKTINAYLGGGSPTAENMYRLQVFMMSTIAGKFTLDQIGLTGGDISPVTALIRYAYHPAGGPVQRGGASTFPVCSVDGKTCDFQKAFSDYRSWYKGSSGRYKSGAPWVGITAMSTWLANPGSSEGRMVAGLIDALESRGANVVLFIPAGMELQGDVDKFFTDPADPGGRALVDALIMANYFVRTSPDLFRRWNIPIITPTYSRDLEDWRQHAAGLRGEFTWQVALPELDGRIEPLMMGGYLVSYVNPLTGAPIEEMVSLPDRIERLAGRAFNWARIRHLPDEDKKLAILYYNMHGGKDDISASYLNVPRSLDQILRRLALEGYTVRDVVYGDLSYGERPPAPSCEDSSPTVAEEDTTVAEEVYDEDATVTEEVYGDDSETGDTPGSSAETDCEAATVPPAGEEALRPLIETLLTRGRNIGGWAPGELRELVEAGAMLLPAEQYIEWYGALPAELREEVERYWGPPPGKLMVQEAVYDVYETNAGGYLVLPAIDLGNVIVAPQPRRGADDDQNILAHSTTVPPNHYYIAFYLWLQKEFGADAVVHLGTHGTLEFLPRRSLALGEDDWPDVLLGNMLNIYPYIMENIAEGTIAKRRSMAVIIDHLIPPLVRAELYGELARLAEILGKWEQAEQEGKAAQAEEWRREILDQVAAADLATELGPPGDDFAAYVERLHDYLEEFKGQLLPYGLHTFGRPPQGELLDQMVEAIVGFDPDGRLDQRDSIRANLSAATAEMDNLIRALSGEFIYPRVGGDPLRRPHALPTGANFFAFDPRSVPDQAAWRIGSQAADDLLRRYHEANGRYPETVGMVLWATETMRTGGETIAMILRLLGVEPRFSGGQLVGVKVTPLDQLTLDGERRPRVDVLVTISGVFRDTFPNVIDVLDQAFRQVANLDEDSEWNATRRHYLEALERLASGGEVTELARILAGARIFGPPPGMYGNMVSDMVETTSSWSNTDDIAQRYIDSMAFAYGAGLQGVDARDPFIEALRHVEATAQVRDGLYGVLDIDDVYEFLGGLTAAARMISGNDVTAYITNTRTGTPETQTFNEFLRMELRTRLLNPQWIEGMLGEGFSGSSTLARHVAHLFGVDALLDAVDDWAWGEVAERFVFDESVRSQIDQHALQSMIAWTLEAARRGMWAADAETVSRLVDAYLQSVAQSGLNCQAHTCGNPVFNEWVAEHASPEMFDQYRHALAAATDRQIQTRDTASPTAESSDSSPPPSSESDEEPQVLASVLPPETPSEERREARQEQENAPPPVPAPVRERPAPRDAGARQAGPEPTKVEETIREEPAPEQQGRKVRAYEVTEQQPSRTPGKAPLAVVILVLAAVAGAAYAGARRMRSA